MLLFLDRPGPGRVDVTGLTEGLTGDDSRDGLGELVADVVCELYTFFAEGIDDIEDLRSSVGLVLADGLDVVEFDSVGSATSGVPVREKKGLSSILPLLTNQGRSRRLGDNPTT